MPGVEVDVFGDEAYGAVDHADLCAAGVSAASGEDALGIHPAAPCAGLAGGESPVGLSDGVEEGLGWHADGPFASAVAVMVADTCLAGVAVGIKFDLGGALGVAGEGDAADDVTGSVGGVVSVADELFAEGDGVGGAVEDIAHADGDVKVEDAIAEALSDVLSEVGAHAAGVAVVAAVGGGVDGIGRAEEGVDASPAGNGVLRGIEVGVEVDGAVEIGLFDVGQEHGVEAEAAPAGEGVIGGNGGLGANVAGREAVEGVVIVVQGDAELFEVVFALGSASRFACLLDGGEEECNEDRDDGDDDE
ncbi:MAG: hypothetical protein RL215_2677 [Planctomycetota bacterium]